MTPFTITPQLHTQVLTYETQPLLTVTTQVYHATTPHPMARRFNRYYQAQVQAYLHFAQHQLLPLAAEQMAQNLPLPTHTATLHQVLTYQDGAIYSFSTHTKDSVQPMRTCRGDTWETKSGFLLPITHFLPRCYKTLLTNAALAQVQDLESQGLAQFHPQLGKSLLKRHLNPHHYYITPKGLCFFYPMYAIAPAVEQIPMFLYPLEAENP